MIGKKEIKKLILKKESISSLTPDESKEVVGGNSWTRWFSKAEGYFCDYTPSVSCNQHMP